MAYELNFLIPASESDSGKTEYGTVYVDVDISVYQHPQHPNWYTANGKDDLKKLARALREVGWPLHRVISIDSVEEACLALRGSYFGGDTFVVDVSHNKSVAWLKV